MARKHDKSKNRPKKFEESDESDSANGNDSASVMSNQSEQYEKVDRRKKKEEAVESSDNDQLECEEIDQFETKLDTVLDYIQSTKCGGMRVKHWESLRQALGSRFSLEYLVERKATLLDVFDRGMRGSDDEIEATALVMTLTLITFGCEDNTAEEIFLKYFSHTHRIMLNPSAKPNARSKCAIFLSLGCFITDAGVEKSREIHADLLTVAFSSNKEVDNSLLTDFYGLQATCLDMYSFLVSIEENGHVEKVLLSYHNKFERCLEAPNLGVRIAAGECVALILENSDHSLLDDNIIDNLCEQLKQLSTDSQKSRSKKELRQQRTNFRQIIQTVQGESITPEEVRFGQEKLIIDSWKLKRYYDTFCTLIGSGINNHLSENALLRDIFELGEVVGETLALKVPKHERAFIHNMNRKYRDMSRNKMRDRRQRQLEI